MRFKKMTEPDWSVWRHVAKLTPEEAASLTMNFCPHVIKRILAEVSYSGSTDPSSMFSLVAGGEGMSFQDAPKFEQRLLILSRTSGEFIEAAELLSVARRCEWDIPTELAAPASPDAAPGSPDALELDNTADTGEATSPSAKEALYKDEPGLRRREKQIRAIEAAIKKMGYPPLSIPYGGKILLSAECRKAQPKLFGSKSQFDETWKEACKSNRVQVENRDKYRPR